MRNKHISQHIQIILKKLIPTHQKFYNFLNDEYLKFGRTTSGIDNIPNGKEMYNHLIKIFTTTNMSADEIHNLGLSEVARISAEMIKVKNQVGFSGSLKEFFDYVRSNKDLMPFTNSDEVINNFNLIHDKMKPQINKLFDLK